MLLILGLFVTIGVEKSEGRMKVTRRMMGCCVMKIFTEVIK